MAEYRITEHPILSIVPRSSLTFYWQGQELIAREGETIASALFANGVRVFGHHARDGAPQGIFCANGQCAQCLVLADGKPVKSCMEPVQPGMRVEPADGLPDLPPVDVAPRIQATRGTPRPGPHHRRWTSRTVGSHRAGQIGHRSTAGGRQAPLGRETGPSDPPFFRVSQRRLCGHAGHRHRHQAGGTGARARLCPHLAGQHCSGRI